MLAIGWIGLGSHTLLSMLPALLRQEVILKAVCDRSPTALARFTKLYRVEQAVEDYRQITGVDAVICVVEYDVHYEVAAHFIARGIPVFIEKTPCATWEQAQRLAELEKESGVFIQTGFNRRFCPSYVMAKELLTRPEFGPVTMYMAKYNAGPYRDERYFLLNHLINHLDLMRFMLGEVTLLSVYAMRVDGRHMGVHVNARANNGALAFIQSNSLQCIQHPMESMEITGVGQSVLVDNIKGIAYRRDPVAKFGEKSPRLEEGHDTLVWEQNQGLPLPNSLLGFDEELCHFMRAAKGQEAPACPFADTVRTMKLLFEVMERLGQ